jgi:beta-mannosidase
VDLGGTWRAIEADEDLRRVFPDPDLDDGGWAEVQVPGHWRSHPTFGDSDGPLLYRCRFDAPRPGGADRRAWLSFDGIFYQGDVWLDRSYLTATEGYFFPHVLEVTEVLRERREHVIAVEVTCARPTDRTAKHNLTGVFQHSDCLDRDWNPGGIWRSVHLDETGPVRITGLRIVCPEATAERAVLEVRAVLDASRACSVSLHAVAQRAVGPPDAVGEPSRTDAVHAERRSDQVLAAGVNRIRWRMFVEEPELWWPHALGDQPLYDVFVEVVAGDEVSDHRRVRTGMRQVRMKNFIATVNGERLYLKGSNHGPTRRALGEATASELERDVLLARQAGLDLLRIHAHITRPELYDAADRHGILLWQDLPLQLGYAGVRRQAVRQAQEAVDLLGHHPSILLWCGHNQPIALDLQPGAAASAPGRSDTTAMPSEPTVRNGCRPGRLPARTVARFAAGQAFPTWNKTALDRSIRRTLEKADASRPVVAHSGILPHPAWGTDSHLWFGWYHGRERGFPAALARLPVLSRFVSEFGAQAVPATAAFCQPERWPDLDWQRLAQAHALQKGNFDRYVPPADYPTFAAWRDATQAYQAIVIRHHIETLRRLKYRPNGGFCQFCFTDSQPAVTWSVLDHERVPKQGYDALAAACAPVIVVADRPAESYRPGETIALDLHVVSDLRIPLVSTRLRARLSWPGGSRTWWFEGDVAADSCVRVGRLSAPLGEAGEASKAGGPGPAGPVTVELDLDWSDGKAHNRYDTVLRAGPRA